MGIVTDAAGELYMIGFQYNKSYVQKIVNAFYLPEGDYNEDGMVDAADYAVWRNSWGETVALGTAADGDGNGIIGQGDYAVWKAHFGESVNLVGSGSHNNVPGPPTSLRLMQLFVALVMFARTRRPSEIAQDLWTRVQFSLLRRVPIPAYAR